MRIFKWLLAAVPLALTGCFEGNKNTEQLCEANSELRCADLNMNDGQCRVARTDLIWHRFDVLKQPTEHNKIVEYGLVAEYKKCLELASQIETIDQTMLKQRRFSALMHSIEEEERIVKDLLGSMNLRPSISCGHKRAILKRVVVSFNWKAVMLSIPLSCNTL